MSMLIRVAALQMVSGPDVARNLEQARRLVQEAAAVGARLVLLPEYFCLMGCSDTDKLDHAEALGTGPIQAACSDMARDAGIILIAGTIPLRHPSGTRVWNTSLVYGATGACIGRYDKIHLFRFQRGSEQYDESRTIGAGSDPVAVDTEGLRVGLSVCYDLRFPELYRAMGQTRPLDLIVVPAAFTHTTGKAHWELLLRARAVENQCYVLAAAQGGLHENGRRTWGHSMLIDPWGDVLSVLPEGAGTAIGDVDPARLAQVRADLPALNHRVL
jgi:predicted amidohydrolase